VKQLWHRIRQSSFLVKWTQWEFYPMYIANIPTVFIWLYFGIRARALFFFSAVNPVIETGGVLGESKINILNRLPANAIPKTLFIERSKINLDYVVSAFRQMKIQYPLICKPNVGERGFLVEKIDDEKALAQYLKKVNVDLLIQDYIDYPLEISVLYYRMPDADKGQVTSVCIKKNLTVIGDGNSTIEQLMQAYPRARFQLDRFQKDFPNLLKTIPKKDKEVLLEPIGNHCRGTTFLNGNQHIDAQLVSVFDELAKDMEGIHYGRFDMKCQSMELLKEGRGFKVLEFNGIASEPAHIYDPNYSVLQAYIDIFQHWKIIYKIYKLQRQKGVKPMGWGEAYTSVRSYFKYMKETKAAL